MPATLEVEGTGDGPSALYLSVSQIDKFTTCEQRWVLAKSGPKVKVARSDALELGTLIHTCKAAWWGGKPWREAWLAAAMEELGSEEIDWKLSRGKLVQTDKGWTVPKVFLRALPIMEAWERVHGKSPDKDPNPNGIDPRTREEVELAGLTLVATELPFDLPVPGVPDVRIRGYLDSVASRPVDKIRVHDELWIIEEKTMGKWGRENQVAWDPQLHVYGWAARQLLGAKGAVFEAISTYNYKYDEDPAERDKDRFKRLPLVFDDRMIDQTMKNVAKVARRAKQLYKNPGLAISNAGDACTYCDFRGVCPTVQGAM